MIKKRNDNRLSVGKETRYPVPYRTGGLILCTYVRTRYLALMYFRCQASRSDTVSGINKLESVTIHHTTPHYSTILYSTIQTVLTDRQYNTVQTESTDRHYRQTV